MLILDKLTFWIPFSISMEPHHIESDEYVPILTFSIAMEITISGCQDNNCKDHRESNRIKGKCSKKLYLLKTLNM